jgi:E3 ubiquitin-protein ligase SHPRH
MPTKHAANYMFGLIGGRSDIPSIRIDSGKRKQDSATRFRDDPNIIVLLLHGCVRDHAKLNWGGLADEVRERQNAGLNVTCASRVFLVESVVHHSFEVQG